ncbi:MAG: hypothetical protein RR341_00630 [Bacteroidales bacterium]
MRLNIGGVFLRLVVVCWLTTFFSCIDSRYNIDNVSDKMHLFGNGIDFPLMDTGDVPFSKLLGKNDDVKVNEFGVYSLSSNPGKLISEFNVVEMFTIPAQHPSFGSGRSYNSPITWKKGEEAEVVFPDEMVNFTAHLKTESSRIDDKIIDVKSAEFDDVYNAILTINILDGSGKPLRDVAVTQIIFKNYKLQLPDELVLSESSSNVVTLNGRYEYREFKVVVPIKGLKNISIQNRRIKIEKDINIGGGFACKVKNLTGVTSQIFMIRPEIEIRAMNVCRIYGKADVRATTIVETVKVGKVPDFLDDKETKLILSNPVLLMDLQNSVTMPFIASITLKTKDATGNYIKDSDGRPIVINIPSISIEGAGTLKKYIAREEVQQYKDKGYKFIKCDDLFKLGLKLPSLIEMSIIGHNDNTQWQKIILGQHYKTTFDYNVDIPLMLDRGSSFTYAETKKGLNEKAFQYFSAKEVYIKSTFVNRYPADIVFALKLLDSEGNELKDIQVTVPDIVKGSETTEVTPDIVPAKTYMKIRLLEKKLGQINRIDAMEWKMKAVFNSTSTITKYQGIKTSLVLDAPYGVEVINK